MRLYSRQILIAVDKYVIGAVNGCVSSAPDFCAEIAMPIAMPNEQNWKREKGRP
jgi:hypothetical protein